MSAKDLILEQDPDAMLTGGAPSYNTFAEAMEGYMHQTGGKEYREDLETVILEYDGWEEEDENEEPRIQFRELYKRKADGEDPPDDDQPKNKKQGKGKGKGKKSQSSSKNSTDDEDENYGPDDIIDMGSMIEYADDDDERE